MAINAPTSTRINDPATIGAYTQLLPDASYVELTPEGLLAFCQEHLKQMDTDIAKKMSGQNTYVALQGKIAALQNKMKNLQGTGGDGAASFDDPDMTRVNDLTKDIDSAIADAQSTGNNDLVRSLEQVRFKLRAGNDSKAEDGKVLIGEFKEMNQMLDSCQANCTSASAVSMIELQSLVAKRSTMLQMTTNIMSTVNEGPKAAVANMRA